MKAITILLKSAESITRERTLKIQNCLTVFLVDNFHYLIYNVNITKGGILMNRYSQGWKWCGYISLTLSFVMFMASIFISRGYALIVCASLCGLFFYLTMMCCVFYYLAANKEEKEISNMYLHDISEKIGRLIDKIDK